MIARPSFKNTMTKPNKKKVKKQYLAGTSGALRSKRKAALKRLNKNNNFKLKYMNLNLLFL